jgi:hypothetical protein
MPAGTREVGALHDAGGEYQQVVWTQRVRPSGHVTQKEVGRQRAAAQQEPVYFFRRALDMYIARRKVHV